MSDKDKNTVSENTEQLAPKASMKQVSQPLTEAELIWNEIKNKEIMMFSLPGQTVEKFCGPKFIEPNRCFLIFKASSAIPAVEAAIGPNYTLEVMDKYIVIGRKKNAF